MSNKTTRYIGTCPCCTGMFKVRNGNLVHHGFQRPGWGSIVGDCFGALRIPHELSPELAKSYLASVEGQLKSEEKALAKLPGLTKLIVKRGRDKVVIPKAIAPESYENS